MADGDSRPARDPEAGRLRGNRSWRVETPRGPALQKLYCERTGPVAALVRELFVSILRVKTSQRPVARKATERLLLRLWRDHGVDAPADWTDEVAGFSAPDVALFEFVPDAIPLWDLLVRPRLDCARRVTVLRAFAAAWGRRHTEALRTRDAALIQEHGTIRHVLVAGERLVWIDLEQAYRPRADVQPLVAREIAGYLRSIWKRVGETAYAADLVTIVDAYPDATVLRASADEYLRPRGLRRALWAADRAIRNDRRRRAKYGALEALDAELRRRGR